MIFFISEGRVGWVLHFLSIVVFLAFGFVSWLSNIHCVSLAFQVKIVTNVQRTKSILLSKEKLCPYIHESLEHHGSPWKLTIANTSGGGE